jgi:hypothetical protein
MGIEPTQSAWKAEVLPLNYARYTNNRKQYPIVYQRHYFLLPPLRFQNWREKDSNLRRLSRQIYSLLHLTALEPLQKIEPRIVLQPHKEVNRKY